MTKNTGADRQTAAMRQGNHPPPHLLRATLRGLRLWGQGNMRDMKRQDTGDPSAVNARTPDNAVMRHTFFVRRFVGFGCEAGENVKHGQPNTGEGTEVNCPDIRACLRQAGTFFARRFVGFGCAAQVTRQAQHETYTDRNKEHTNNSNQPRRLRLRTRRHAVLCLLLIPTTMHTHFGFLWLPRCLALQQHPLNADSTDEQHIRTGFGFRFFGALFFFFFFGFCAQSTVRVECPTFPEQTA